MPEVEGGGCVVLVGEPSLHDHLQLIVRRAKRHSLVRPIAGTLHLGGARRKEGRDGWVLYYS